MSIIIPANSAVAGGFDVANSCNFEEGSLHKSVSSPSTTFTISIWVKLTNQYVATSSIGQRLFGQVVITLVLLVQNGMMEILAY